MVAEFRGPSAHVAVLAPCHDDGVRRAAGVDDLVPADHAAAAGGEPPRYLRHEPALQLGFGPQAQRAHPLPGPGAVVPFGGRALVAAEVDVGAGEDIHHLVEHVRAELDGGVIDVQHVPGNAPAGAHLDRLLAAVVSVTVAKLGVGGNRGLHMAGHVNLRHHRHVPLRSVGDDLRQVGDRVAAAVRGPVEPLLPG